MAPKTLTGVLLDERTELSVGEICRACSGSTSWVIELVEEGVLEPVGDEQTSWRFSAVSLHKAQVARRLQQDLDINTAGIALALDLMEEMEVLRARLSRFEKNTRT